MQKNAFDRNKHIYKNDSFSELVKNALCFFNGTPIYSMPLVEKFSGTGVYALYYIGDHFLYSKYKSLNSVSYDFPIYVGKAVPKGWRQSRISDNQHKQSTELYSRIKEHGRNILSVESLAITDFKLRFIIFENSGSEMIAPIEAALIKSKKPLWNTTLDGFGNHAPGSGRYEQAQSDWDQIHPGRSWAKKCRGEAKNKSIIIENIKKHFDSV